MQPQHPEHPFRIWRHYKGYSYERVAELVAKLGGRAGARYIEFIEQSQKRPRWALAEILSQVADGAVTAEQIMRHPLKADAPKARRKRSAA